MNTIVLRQTTGAPKNFHNYLAMSLLAEFKKWRGGKGFCLVYADKNIRLFVLEYRGDKSNA